MPLHPAQRGMGRRLSGRESYPALLDSRRIQRSPEGLMTDPIGTGSLRHPLGRRRFMAAMAGGLLAAPLGARAQQAGKVWRIGLLDGGPLPANLTVKGPFR